MNWTQPCAALARRDGLLALLRQTAAGIGPSCCRGWVMNRTCLDSKVDV
jgi:hypothetical protein